MTSPPAAEASGQGIWPVASALGTVAVELALIVAATAALYTLAAWLAGRLAALRRQPENAARALQTRIRVVLVMAGAALAIVSVCYNGWLAFRGIDARRHTLGVLGNISAGIWIGLALAIAKLALAAVGVVIALRAVRFGLDWCEAWLNRWDQLRANDVSVRALVNGIYRAIAITGWLLLAVLAVQLLSAPGVVVDGLLRAIRAYLVIAVGLLLIRASVAVVDTLEGFSHRYSQDRGWRHYYDHLRPLVPTFRACFEYALWVVLASLVLVQVGAGRVAVWGPSLIEAIGIFFLSRVVIELGRLEIGRRLLPPEGLDEMTRRRRETIAPLVRTAFTYATYFTAAVLILASLGFNPVPFLAGAGILGLVIGFGAQSLINDVVCGFFILFENTYLVGDVIEAGHAKGVVEEIEFRTTKLRDAEGRVHVVRNGDVKEVVNYSKGYTSAVVPVEVSYDADLHAVFSVLREAGDRLRRESGHVIGDMEIDGIVAFGPAAMTIRTRTRVKPGSNEAGAAELRLAIKEAFDRRVDRQGRRALVPKGFVGV